jgi:hypothetical protein
MGDETFYQLVPFYSDWELLMEPGVPPGQPDGRRDILLSLLRLLVLEH